MLVFFLRCSTRTSPRFFNGSIHFPRSYASSATAKTTTRTVTATPKHRLVPRPGTSSASATSPPQPSRPTSNPTPSNAVQARNKALLAEQILQAGREEIYKAPSHAGLLFTAWAVFASGSMCCIYFVNSGYLDSDKMKARNLPVWVAQVYKLVVGFMGICSGIFLAQSFAFVSAIRLVRDAGRVRLLVYQRPWFPLWKHHRYLVEPGRLGIERRVAVLATRPQAARAVTDVGQQALVAEREGSLLQRIAVKPFLIMRKLFFHEGVVKMVVPSGPKGENKETWVRLDLDGKCSNNGKDLLDLATIRT